MGNLFHRTALLNRAELVLLLVFFIFFHSVAGIAANDGAVPGGAKGGIGYPVQRPALNFAGAADMAVAASVDLRNAYASQRIREQGWNFGIRTYFPRLGLTVSENDRLQEIGTDSFIKNYSVNVDQLVWDGGRTSMARNIERMELNLMHRQLERTAQDIAESALSVYRSVLSSRTVLAIREAALDSLEAQRRILASEVALGLALPVDLAEADLNLAEVKLEIISLRSDLAEMEKQFAELLGLDTLPELAEKVDVSRAGLLPGADRALSLAQERNPDLVGFRFSILKRQGELKFASRSLIPSFRLQGNFGVSGRTYPLTRYNWSLGINIELAGPWLQNSFALQTGIESPHDRTAQLQNNFSPLPDPASSLNRKQAELALALEREKYQLAYDQTGRTAQRGIERCSHAEQRRVLALEALTLAGERYRLEEVRLGLGQITRLSLMEALLQYTQMEVAAVNAAVALLEAERELERFLDLKPGELAFFASGNN